MPSGRPTPDVYNAQDFLKFFQNTVPQNYQLTQPQPVASLPAPYFYSDFSIGLLGLMLGGNPNVPLSNKALDGWAELLQNRLLLPLAMWNTYLYPPPHSQASLALGYNQAMGTAVVAQGQVREIELEASGTSPACPSARLAPCYRRGLGHRAEGQSQQRPCDRAAGGLPGFSTQVSLMPARGLAVVVFVNSNGEKDTGEKVGQAELVARNILYALYYKLVQPRTPPKLE